MTVSFSQCPIKLDMPLQLVGYDKIRTAYQQHDELFVSLLQINDIKFISIDCLGVSERLVSQIRQKVSPVYVFATHTHNGPDGLLDTNNPYHPLYGLSLTFGQYDELMEKKILDAIDYCLDNLVSSPKLWFKEFKIEDLYSNRNQSELDYEQRVLILENEHFILIHLACHPTILGSSINEVSADFVHSFRKLSDKPVMFINGPAGDISTRYTRHSQSFEECDRFGQIIMDKANQAVSKPLNIETNYLDYEISLQTKMKEDIFNFETSELALKYSIIKLGPLTFVTLPLEVCSQLTLSLDCYILGYCNDYLLYLCDEKSYHKEFYEAVSSPFLIHEGHRLIRHIKEQLNEINSSIS